jgi:hypothetical protein
MPLPPPSSTRKTSHWHNLTPLLRIVAEVTCSGIIVQNSHFEAAYSTLVTTWSILELPMFVYLHEQSVKSHSITTSDEKLEVAPWGPTDRGTHQIARGKVENCSPCACCPNMVYMGCVKYEKPIHKFEEALLSQNGLMRRNILDLQCKILTSRPPTPTFVKNWFIFKLFKFIWPTIT